MSQPTPGQWTVGRDTRTGSDGKKYGLEVVAHVPADLQRPWESAGYVPVADIFHPSNPIRLQDYDDPAIQAEILATREANARLIAHAKALLNELKHLAGLIGRLPENGRGTVQGVEINEAYSKAMKLIEAIES